MGYHRAGFEIVGVDHQPQPHYPFEFIQAEALNVWTWPAVFDAVHASPPCQAYSIGTAVNGHRGWHPDLLEPTRELLIQSKLPYVIENVVGAPLLNPIQLCGSSFGLDIQRHRLFECSFPIMGLECSHYWQTPRFPPNRAGRKGKKARVVTVAGKGGPREDPMDGGGKADVAEWRRVMGIDWMSRDELAQAIPPAYTQYIGNYLREYLLFL